MRFELWLNKCWLHQRFTLELMVLSETAQGDMSVCANREKAENAWRSAINCKPKPSGGGTMQTGRSWMRIFVLCSTDSILHPTQNQHRGTWIFPFSSEGLLSLFGASIDKLKNWLTVRTLYFVAFSCDCTLQVLQLHWLSRSVPLHIYISNPWFHSTFIITRNPNRLSPLISCNSR